MLVYFGKLGQPLGVDEPLRFRRHLLVGTDGIQQMFFLVLFLSFLGKIEFLPLFAPLFLFGKLGSDISFQFRGARVLFNIADGIS